MIVHWKITYNIRRLSAFMLLESKRPSTYREKDLHTIQSYFTRAELAYELLERVMAKKTSKDKISFEFKGYININIHESQYPAVEKFMSDDKSIWHDFTTMVSTGYTFKFYYDGNSEAYKVVVTCFYNESPNFGYSMSAYGNDWFTALAAVLFKHVEIADGDWSSFSSTTNRKFG